MTEVITPQSNCFLGSLLAQEYVGISEELNMLRPPYNLKCCFLRMFLSTSVLSEDKLKCVMDS